MAQFNGKVALITGAASGIGLATAKAFAHEGAKVFLADLNGEKVALEAETMRKAGFKAQSCEVDISNFESCQNMVKACKDAFGALHIAFNNAGVPTPMGIDFQDLPIEEWDRVISINLSGMFYCLKAELPLMIESGGSAVVNTASVTSVIAGPGMPAYVASKHGVVGLTKAASVDFIKHGIRVNAIAPGITASGMTAPMLDDAGFKEHVKMVAPIGRVATSEEIAKSVLMLASDNAAYCVGAILFADGGMSII